MQYLTGVLLLSGGRELNGDSDHVGAGGLSGTKYRDGLSDVFF